jgi:hypothetical protein
MMAKDADPFELSASAKQTMAQAYRVADTYLDFLKGYTSSVPSGGTELGEKLKDHAVENINAAQGLAKRLSKAKDFDAVFRIQSEFMISQMNALGMQAMSLGKTYMKEAAEAAKKPSS